MSKITIGKIKAVTLEVQPHLILEVEKTPKSDNRVERTSTQNYDTRYIIKRVNHMTTFKDGPKMFSLKATEENKKHIGTDYFACIDPKKETIIVEPMVNHIHCKTAGILGVYKDLVNIDEPVWTDSMCNKLDRLSQRQKKTCRNGHNIFRFPQRQTKGHKGNLCDSSNLNHITVNKAS